MNYRTLDRTTLRVLADAIGRIDYAAADMEAAREAIRDDVKRAIDGYVMPMRTKVQPFRVEQFERAHGNSDIKLTGFRLWDDTGDRPVCVGETYPQPWPVACNRANAERLAQLPLLEVAADAAVADTIALPSDPVRTAAQALLDAFGSDVPDWLRDEASALEAALLHTKAPLLACYKCGDDKAPVGGDMGQANWQCSSCATWNADDDDALNAALSAEALHPRHEEEPVTRTVTMDELGPEAQAAARHALAIGADRVSVSTSGVHYWRGDIEMQRPGETYQQLGDRIDRRN